jgi:hypothetical protein
MKRILIAGVVLLALGFGSPTLIGSARADVLPDSLLGHWKENPIDEKHIEPDAYLRTDESVGHGSYDGYDIWSDRYEIYDADCKILKVDKRADTLYTVEAYCHTIGDPNDELKEARTEINEFELVRSGTLLIVSPVGS